jgi:small subunit ribosomal protein S13
MRLCGYEIPENKKIFVSLQYIKGIGKTRSLNILKKNDINKNIITSKINSKDLLKIEKSLNDFTIGEKLTNLIKSKIEYKKRLKTFEGMRHLMNLPIHGRTKCNAKTRKRK